LFHLLALELGYPHQSPEVVAAQRLYFEPDIPAIPVVARAVGHMEFDQSVFDVHRKLDRAEGAAIDLAVVGTAEFASAWELGCKADLFAVEMDVSHDQVVSARPVVFGQTDCVAASEESVRIVLADVSDSESHTGDVMAVQTVAGSALHIVPVGSQVESPDALAHENSSLVLDSDT
jgi:hypothetical protein